MPDVNGFQIPPISQLSQLCSLNDENNAHDTRMKTMSYRSSYQIQGRFHFYESDDELQRKWKMNARTNIKQVTFLEGILLKSLDADNPYPYVDYAVFCSGLAVNHNQNHIPGGPSPDHHVHPTPDHHVHPHPHTPPVRNHALQPAANDKVRMQGDGIYDDLEFILRDGVKPLPRTPVSKDSIYFLSAFRTDGHLDSLEDSWKTWSGADYVLWKCPRPLKLRRITFLKSTSSRDPFTFIVLCECEEGLNVCDTAREFVERLKERRCGMVGLYQVERYYISSRTKT